MDIVLYQPDLPGPSEIDETGGEMILCEDNQLQSDVCDTWDKSDIPSSPPVQQNQELYEKFVRNSKMIDDSSSDPLSGPSGSCKRNIHNTAREDQETIQPTPKKNSNNQFEVFDDDDSTSDIIASAPRLDSSKYAKPGPEDISHASKINQQQDKLSVNEELLIARDHIVRAYYATQNRNEQSRLLDLLEIFREYTEKGHLTKASNIITTQIANLEQATKQIETKTRSLQKTHNPSTIQQNSAEGSKVNQQAQSSHPPTMASIAGKNMESSNQCYEWTVVGKKTSAQAKVTHPTQPKTKKTRRVILIQNPSETTTVSPLQARNHINQAFSAKGVKGPVIALVSKTHGNNIAITTTDEYTADFFIEKKDIWQSIIPHETIQKDEPWYKVVAHGIPLADFDNDEGMEMIKDEVSIFNKGLKPIGMPHWISTIENRKVNKAGSVAIAFATEEEANRAIRNRLYIAGISVRVTKFHTVAPTTQCTNCQGFGHLDSYCRKQASCGLCGDKHSTQQHYCSVCKSKGKSCTHLSPKCVNCTGDHQANSKTCQVYLAIKNKDIDMELL